MKESVIIPTYKAGADFSRVIESLNKQTTPVHLIIIESGSSDCILEQTDIAELELIEVDKIYFNHGTTRNLAAANVESEFIIFLTQDAVPADEYMVEELLKPMQADPNIAICYGRHLPNKDAGLLEQFAREFNYPPCCVLKKKEDIPAMGLKTFFCSNSCSAIRCSVFKELGGFKNNVIVNEDMLFAAKAIMAGYSVYYNADAKVYHSHHYSLCRLFRRYFLIGRFFADNQWILEKTKLKGYGLDTVKAGIQYLWHKKRPHLIIVFFAELLLKTIAVKLGWYYQKMHKK